MAKTLNARLDDRSEELLRELEKYWGNNTSEVVRRALRALAAITPRARGERIIGLGKFESLQSDLGSNKDRLKGFGS